MRIFQWFFLVNIFLGFATLNASGLTLGKTYYEVNHAEMNLLQLNWRLSLPAKKRQSTAFISGQPLSQWFFNAPKTTYVLWSDLVFFLGEIENPLKIKHPLNILQSRFLGFKLFLVQPCLNGLNTKTWCFSG